MTKGRNFYSRHDITFEPIVAGALKTFLAETPEDIQEVQSLRYEIFSKEIGACLPDPKEAPNADPFDRICSHLVVKDTTINKIVGTYRLARRQEARLLGAFLTENEFNLSCLLSQPDEILELSRACVALPYRTLPTLTLLWRGLAEYALHSNIAYFFGCASFPGTDPFRFAHALSYLGHERLAPESFRPTVLPHMGQDIRILPQNKIDKCKVLEEMPPLIKGYLRIGGFVGDGLFVDHGFNTTDVCIVVKTDILTERYAHYFNVGSQETKRFSVR